MPGQRAYQDVRTSEHPRRLGLWAILLVAIGCAPAKNWVDNGFKVGPEYCPPVPLVAEQWIEFNDPHLITQTHNISEQLWWRGFDDPFIDHLVDLAHKQNLSLRAAGYRILEAQAQHDIAVGGLLPQTQQAMLQYDQTQYSRNGNRIGVSGFPFRSFGLWTTGFNAAWELDVWGRLRRTIEASDAELAATVEAYDVAIVSLTADTVSAYVEVRGYQQRLEFARQNIEGQETTLQLANARFEAGDTDRLDVLQAEAILEETRALLPELERGLRHANNRLSVLLGIPPHDLTRELGEGPIPQITAEIVVDIPAALLRRRPDVRRAERQVAAQSARIGIATAELLPTFAITGTLNWQAFRFHDMFSSASNAGTLGPGVHWDVLNYGRLANNVRVHDARFQQLAITYQHTVLEANREAEDAIADFLTAKREVQLLERSSKALAVAVELANSKYELGEVDFNRVNDLQRTLVQLQSRLAMRSAEVALSAIRVYRTLGGGWQLQPLDESARRDLTRTERLPPPPVDVAE